MLLKHLGNIVIHTVLWYISKISLNEFPESFQTLLSAAGKIKTQQHN